MTYYTVLGVSEKASQEEIKAAYMDLIKQVHPDKLGSAPSYWKKKAEEKTKEVNEAYTVLSEKRQQYDRRLAALRAPRRQPQSPPSAPVQYRTSKKPVRRVVTLSTVGWKTWGVVTIAAIAFFGGLAFEIRHKLQFDPNVSYSTIATVYNDDGSENDKPSEIDWSTYTPFNPLPKADAQTCPSEDFVNNKLVKNDNCKTIPKGATGRAKNIYGAWFFIKMK
jgi:curved DNA-binding protein CbpA